MDRSAVPGWLGEIVEELYDIVLPQVVRSMAIDMVSDEIRVR